MAAYGEFRFGAGRGTGTCCWSRSVPGSAAGSSRTDGCSAARTASRPEIGHIIVEPEGPLCGCGNRGCWEQVAAGRAIDRMGREEAREHEHSHPAAPREAATPDQVTGELVTQAAMQGDDAAKGILAEVGRRLGQGSRAS